MWRLSEKRMGDTNLGYFHMLLAALLLQNPATRHCYAASEQHGTTHGGVVEFFTETSMTSAWPLDSSQKWERSKVTDPE